MTVHLASRRRERPVRRLLWVLSLRESSELNTCLKNAFVVVFYGNGDGGTADGKIGNRDRRY